MYTVYHITIIWIYAHGSTFQRCAFRIVVKGGVDLLPGHQSLHLRRSDLAAPRCDDHVASEKSDDIKCLLSLDMYIYIYL